MSFKPMSVGWIAAHCIAVYLLLVNLAAWALLVTGMVEIVPGVGWVSMFVSNFHALTNIEMMALYRWVTE